MTELSPILPVLERSRGRAELVLREDADGQMRPVRLFQQGSAKLLMPRTDGDMAEAVLLNTSGGLTAGDSFTAHLQLEDGARAVLATQTAERVYRAAPGLPAAAVAITLDAGAGAVLHWLPQETILFNGAAIRRRTEIRLHPTATLIAVETLILGRQAMGETVRRLILDDRRDIRVGGRLLHRDHLRLDPDALAGGPATLAGAVACASLVAVGPEFGLRLPALRAALSLDGVSAGASALPGRLVARILSPDPGRLRQALLAALAVLRDGRPVPRVWPAPVKPTASVPEPEARS